MKSDLEIWNSIRPAAKSAASRTEVRVRDRTTGKERVVTFAPGESPLPGDLWASADGQQRVQFVDTASTVMLADVAPTFAPDRFAAQRREIDSPARGDDWGDLVESVSIAEKPAGMRPTASVGFILIDEIRKELADRNWMKRQTDRAGASDKTGDLERVAW